MHINPVGVRDYAGLRLADLVAGKRPVRIQGFIMPGVEQIDRKISALKLTEYELDENNLAVSERQGVMLSHPGSIKNSSTKYYRANTLQNAADFFGGNNNLPYRCDHSFYFKSRIWLAAKDTRTPLHRDLAHNFILVLKGKKTIRMAVPGATSSVYSNALFSRAPNFARLNLHEPDFSLFPRAQNLTVYEAQISATELLYLPPLWWHDVKNTEETTSANFWFAPFGFYGMAAFATSFLNKISAFWTGKRQ